jgi:hypothetical protein
VQLLCNRYFAFNAHKMITITKAFRPACSTALREARFPSNRWTLNTCAFPRTYQHPTTTRRQIIGYPELLCSGAKRRV